MLQGEWIFRIILSSKNEEKVIFETNWGWAGRSGWVMLNDLNSSGIKLQQEMDDRSFLNTQACLKYIIKRAAVE